ncbi:MAG: lactate utilization protein [Candidatus Micrarchaeota archaeon]|nr:lactate utilization protein [Candidatus Micrarchaeota archaeon]
MDNWETLADDDSIERTIKALGAKGIDAFVVGNSDEARLRVLEMIPKGSEVMPVTSATLDQTGIAGELNGPDYRSLKKAIQSEDDEAKRHELRRKSLSPDYVIGSVHAVTEDGRAVIASGSGSQLPPYSYGAKHVIWVVGTQKIVKDLDSALRRVYEHSLPLESERIRRIGAGTGSNVNQVLVVNSARRGRITIIFVKEKLGF